MALTVLNNTAAAMTLGELNKNVSNLGKQLKKVATGTKITGAGDGAAEYNIAEKMQVQLRSLAQDIENTRTGRSILKVAEGGIQGIVDELRDMKQLAINAANDTNTDADRATIQKEFDEKLRQIDDIVSTTNYNGKLLLNGTYARIIEGGITGSNQNAGASTGPRGATATSVTSTGPTGAATNVPSNGQIDYGGVYTIPADFTGTINISSVAAAGGVKLSQVSGTTLTDVNIVVDAPQSGTAKLWIENLNITNSTNNNVIQFSANSSVNVLTLIGDNNIELSNATTKAAINMGKNLEIQGNGSSLTIANTAGSGACIGTDGDSSASAGNLSITNGTFTLHSGYGAAIGSGGDGATIGNISIYNATVNMTGGTFAGIGSGGGGAACGDITVRHSTINDLFDASYPEHASPSGRPVGSIDTCIGSGYSGSSCGDIRVEDCIVHAENSDSALVGAGDAGDPDGGCGDIFISNSDIIGYSDHGAAVGSGRNATAGEIWITNATKIQHESPDGAAIGSGENGHVGKIHIDKSSLDLLDASNAYVDSTHKIPGIGKGRGHSTGNFDIDPVPDETVAVYLDGNPLKIHTGTKANQRINCFIENLGAKALFGVKTDEELAAVATVRTRVSAQRLLGDLHDPSIEGPLDKAINYALGEITQMGAYINRLEATEETITINHENTTSSESVIRDADMAREMTEYTKSNILSQAAQSMLAQANQNSSSVLSLLQ
ncbi:flagellin [Selenomonas sp. KH1T6]|nr:flagellin [Selenomonas ruminantium]